MAKHHDTGYRELFSHPEVVQQLIEGFAPAELAELMDFSTLKKHNGHYITPLDGTSGCLRDGAAGTPGLSPGLPAAPALLSGRRGPLY
ncbi:Rpn family recombination-promoting nuclease/putative transposase [Halomonas sp.]|uniref:Rpn family recombination-promoting nuclease/putative transposase n=1 Tax=Halomonas sp. TaxID=1486246 RepID=UPI003D152CA7